MVQASSPHTSAEAAALWLVPSAMASRSELGCEPRRVLDAGAQTTRHDTAQSSGIVQALRIVNATLASPWSDWSKLAQLEIERRAWSANAGTQIEMARAHVAHRAQQVARMTDLR
jgi:hypothetical protein